LEDDAQDVKQLQTQRSHFHNTGRYNHKRDDSYELPIVREADQVALNRIKLNNILTDDNNNDDDDNKEEEMNVRRCGRFSSISLVFIL
jgi:hypothetical protein